MRPRQYSDPVSSRSAGPSIRVPAVHLVDVLVYLVVLGLFVQFFPQVISESFVVALITAIILKLALEVVVAAKTRIVGRFRSASTPTGRIVSAALLIATAAGSKFVILWLTDVILGDAVHLGGFFSVTLLVVSLMVARALVRLVVVPGPPADPVA